jgi:glutamate synthase (NADPH/NADH) large chain
VDRAVWHRGQSDEAQLKKLLEDHNCAGPAASRARELLDTGAESRQKFVKVFPIEYKRALSELWKAKWGSSQRQIVKVAIQKRSNLQPNKASAQKVSHHG